MTAFAFILAGLLAAILVIVIGMSASTFSSNKEISKSLRYEAKARRMAEVKLKEITESRDTDLKQLNRKNDSLKDENARLLRERETLQSKLKDAEKLNDEEEGELLSRIDTLLTERDELLIERDQLVSQSKSA